MLLELDITYIHNMFRLWTPDQLTPRASEKNPFNDVPTTPTAIHPLLSSAISVTSDLTPGQPTTHLSLHAPVFNMQPPPPAKNLTKSKQPPLATSPSPHTPISRGQIHVKLIQARALNVRSINARPYVVVQFEQNEFVSRDPTLESDKEVKGTPTSLSTSTSSTALSALGAIGSKAALQGNRKNSKNSKDPSPPSSAKVSSQLSLLSSQPQPFFGQLSAHNPVWKHEVSLYAALFCLFLSLSLSYLVPL